MLLKIAIIALYCFLSFQIVTALPKSSRATSEQAQTAFDSLYAQSLNLVNALVSTIQIYKATQNQKLVISQSVTVESLNQKLDDVSSKIQQIQGSFRRASISDEYCTYGIIDAIETYRTRLITRTKKCTEGTAEVIANLVNETFTEIRWQQNSLLSCYNRSLQECRSYANDGGCYDFVIANIEKARDGMVTDFKLIELNFVNKIISLKLPCQDLIGFEVSVYPDYNLETVSTCAENSLRMARPWACQF